IRDLIVTGVQTCALPILLWHARYKRSADQANFWALARRCKKFVKVVGQKLHVLTCAVLENELKSTGGADAGYRRRREAENSPLRSEERRVGKECRSRWAR